MPSKMHFISGLPRSGSTLLCALLRQNPRFRTDITGPLALLCGIVHQQIGGAGEFSSNFNDARRADMLRGLFESYYRGIEENQIVFDTNRTWTSRAALLGTLYPNSRIICCVRDIGWIIDSLERIRATHPLKASRLFKSHPFEANSIYTRVDALMNAETGLIGTAWSMLREAWFSESADRLLVVPYDSIATDPEGTLRKVYSHIGEPYFLHDFQNVLYEAPDYDEGLGLPGLHTVQKVVEFKQRQPVIPPDVFSKYAKTHFWANPDLNPRGVRVL